MTKLADDIILQHHHITEMSEDLGALARVNPDALNLDLSFNQVAQFANTDTYRAMQRMSQDHGSAFYHAVFLAVLNSEDLAQTLEAQLGKDGPEYSRGMKDGLHMALDLLKGAENSEDWSRIVCRRAEDVCRGSAANSD